MAKWIAAALAMGLWSPGTAALAQASPASPPYDRIGVASLAANGTLTVTYDETSPGWTPGPLVIVPEGMNAGQRAAYDSYIEMAGGLRPGESKPLYSFDAVVKMNDDRSLTVGWSGSQRPGELIVEPYLQTVQPDEGRYDEFVALAGGLEPGQSRGIRFWERGVFPLPPGW